MRKVLDVPADSLKFLGNVFLRFPRPSLFAEWAPVHILQFYGQNCDPLIDVVVKFTSDPRALHFLRLQNSAFKIGNGFFGKLASREINTRSDVPYKRTFLSNRGTPVSKIQ